MNPIMKANKSLHNRPALLDYTEKQLPPLKRSVQAQKVNKSLDRRVEQALSKTEEVGALLARNRLAVPLLEDSKPRPAKRMIQVIQSRLLPMGRRYLEMILSVHRLDCSFRKDYLYRIQAEVEAGTRYGEFHITPVLKYDRQRPGQGAHKSSVTCDTHVTKDSIKITTQNLEAHELLTSIFIFKGGFMPPEH
jgi:hypothetical protein